MSAQQVQKDVDVVVNYTYYLADGKEFSELECLLFKYSFLKTRSHGYIINIHCNNNFQNLCQELKIVPDKFIPLEEDPDIDFKTFWAYHKIKVYDKQPIGEWHLDVDAVFKEVPIIHDVAIQVGYYDIPEYSLGNVIPFKGICIPENYTLPKYAKASFEGFNMSAVIFYNENLKKYYCANSFKFMQHNKVDFFETGWEHMVYVEQSLLKQYCDYYKYSYNYINKDSDYYHLGPTKKNMPQDLIDETIKLIKNRIKTLK